MTAAPERVYCLPAAALPRPRETVLPLDDALYRRLATEGEYRLRDEVETDEAWRQIIPYAVVTEGPRVLLVERLRSGSEARLHAKWSIGLGGHINPGDLGGARDVIEAGLARELAEELELGAYRTEPLGLIHSAEGAVSRVHTGVLLRVRTETPPRVRERHKLAGGMAAWDEVAAAYERLEGWSRLAVDHLRAGRAAPAS